MGEAIQSRNLNEWTELFTDNDIPFAVAQNWEEVLEDRQAKATDVYHTMKYPTGVERMLVRQPVFIGTELPDYGRGPLLGEHSEQILRALGYGDEELIYLHEKGVYNTWDDLKDQHGG